MRIGNLARRLAQTFRRHRQARPARWLIVNGDDFGQSPGINEGIIEAHRRGILTSASLMVRRNAAAEAVKNWRKSPDLSLGLHVDLGAWMRKGGVWTMEYQIVPLLDASAVAAEVAGQLETFRSLTGQNPTHLDSHQHVHNKEPIRTILLNAARELSIPLRACTSRIKFCGDYYGQTRHGLPLLDAISVEALQKILVSLPAGLTEMACHPALGDNIDDPVYCFEREHELEALCDPRVRSTLAEEGIELHSYNNAGNSWWNG